MNDICKRRQKRYSYTTLNRQFSLSLWIYYSVLHTAMSNWNVPLNTPVRICCSCQTTKSKLRNTGQPESRINPLCTGWPVTGCSQVVRRRLSLQNKQSISRSETIKCQARPAWQYNTERQTKSKCMLKSVGKVSWSPELRSNSSKQVQQCRMLSVSKKTGHHPWYHILCGVDGIYSMMRQTPTYWLILP